MAMTDCIKCWETPCVCGYEYRYMPREKLQTIQAAVNTALGEGEPPAVDVYNLPNWTYLFERWFYKNNGRMLQIIRSLSGWELQLLTDRGWTTLDSRTDVDSGLTELKQLVNYLYE